MSAVRSEILPPLPTSLRTSVQPVATIGGGGAQNADVQFLINGPDLTKLETHQPAAASSAQDDPGRRRRRHVAERRQARAVGAGRSAEGGRPRRAGRRRGRGAAPAGRRRPGDDLQRRRRAVRSAPARASRRIGRRKRRSAALTVPSSRLGSVPLENVADFAPGSAPSDINRLARQRQVTMFCEPAARRHRRRGAERDAGGVRRAAARRRTTAAGFTGRSSELGRAAQNFVLAFVLSLSSCT